MGTHRCATMVTLDTVSIVPKITRNVNKREPFKISFHNLAKYFYRSMPAENCFVCGVKSTELRTVHVGGTGLQLCSQCRWKREHKCLVKGCTTPASKVKLKSLPGRLLQATEVVRGEIFSQFGMQPDLRQCCKSCFTKLHRTIAEFSTNSSRANTCTAEKLQNKKGRPSVSFGRLQISDWREGRLSVSLPILSVPGMGKHVPVRINLQNLACFEGHVNL